MKVMHQRIRGSKLAVLSPASHFANRDQPEAWNRAAVDGEAGDGGGSVQVDIRYHGKGEHRAQ